MTNTDQEPIKIVIMGMENAGKSTILDVLTKKIETTPLTPPDMHPTKGVERKTLNSAVVWDFGGQELYRNEYLADPDSYLRSIAFTYFVVDVQDYYRHYSSIMYFMAVFPTIEKNCPEAELVFLFNKMVAAIIEVFQNNFIGNFFFYLVFKIQIVKTGHFSLILRFEFVFLLIQFIKCIKFFVCNFNF